MLIEYKMSSSKEYSKIDILGRYFNEPLSLYFSLNPLPHLAASCPLSQLLTTSLLSISVSLLHFLILTSLLYFLDSICEQYHKVFVFLRLTYLT